MAIQQRKILIILGGVVALILLAVLSIPLFLNADSFRVRIESAITKSLGRKVTLGELKLSILSGSLRAENASIADDPAFSTQPFLQASRVKIGIEVMPLILSREVHITGFDIDSPKITLLRATNGTWNYSTIGRAQQNADANNKDSNSIIPNLTIGSITVSNGQLIVGNIAAPGSPAAPRRTYDSLNLEAKNFSFQNSFSYTASVRLPAEGAVSLSGNAGPINSQDASLTPFNAHLEIKHLDPLAAGFVDASAGLTGLIQVIDLQASWNGKQLHLANLVVDTPTLTVTRDNRPTTETAPPPPADSSNMLSTFSADRLQVKNGTLTVTSPEQSKPALYQQLNGEITGIAPTSSSPFQLSAQIPGGGSLTGDGNAGPINQVSVAQTPFNAHLLLNHLDLATSGVVAPEAGLAGTANADIKATSDGHNVTANISSTVQSLRIAANGSPSAKPVALQVNAVQNLNSLSGQLQKADITIGRAVIGITGTYQTTGPNTALNLKVATQSASIDELQDFLPSVGVHLPTGSRLQGGTLTANLNVTGTGAAPIISGPISLNNTNLAGFDLGSKLSAVTVLTGAKTGSVTAIRSLSTNLSINGGNVRTDNLALLVPALGSATGAGTISAAGALNYNVVLKLTGVVNGVSGSTGGLVGQLAGLIPGGSTGAAISNLAGNALRNGIPVAIGGTTSNPTFTPDMNGLVSSATNSKGATKPSAAPSHKQSDPLSDALGGFLGGHR